MSNLLPKLKAYRERAIGILTPFKEAEQIKKTDLHELGTEFKNVFKGELDKEEIRSQWYGIVLSANRHFHTSEKIAARRAKEDAAAQYELFAE